MEKFNFFIKHKLKYAIKESILINLFSKWFFLIFHKVWNLEVFLTNFCFIVTIVTIIGKRNDIPLNEERLFVYNKEQTFFIEELFQWIMGSYQTESLFA
ncbi:hypothetical protein COJ70_24335 [Priestia megaterium]|nr:hypothetical protein COJ70_24335 [Priestia megaterium]